ncbi:mechanosensitive ion channel [Massilia horti]|uniref:Mechanosensitive ion channel n=2 Tax=Massilia horti TaxID=2562153 RepID=A0A4Y9SW24_9BURK|nr:mechanosensitive ion channel [Massilia horti]TFW30628.1 mechanosensitive ion channel [Massilia horti]
MPLADMLQDLLGDLSDPSILWQAAVIIASAGLGWLLARSIRSAWLHGRDDHNGMLRIGVESFARVLAPLLALGLLTLGKYFLARNHLHVNVLRVAIPLASSLAMIRLAFYLLRRVFARHGQLGAALQTFEKLFALVVWLGLALYLTGAWPDILRFLEHTSVPLGRHRVQLSDALQAVVSVVLMLMLALWAGAALEERLMGVPGIHTSLRVVLARTSRAVLVLVAVLLSLSMVGLDLTVLSVFGGALGVGLGLGMQRIASNYVSGFVILLERSLSIGDMISVDKYSGKVTHINTRYTVLQGLDGVETVLPNEMLISGPVQNQSLTNRRVRGSTRVIVAYGSDLAVVMPLLQQQAASIPRVLAEPGPGVGLARFAPEGYELDVGFWIGDPENGTGGVVSELNKKIYALVQSGEIKLGIPTFDTRLLDAHIAAVVARNAQNSGNS